MSSSPLRALSPCTLYENGRCKNEDALDVDMEWRTVCIRIRRAVFARAESMWSLTAMSSRRSASSAAATEISRPSRSWWQGRTSKRSCRFSRATRADAAPPHAPIRCARPFARLSKRRGLSFWMSVGSVPVGAHANPAASLRRVSPARVGAHADARDGCADVLGGVSRPRASVGVLRKTTCVEVENSRIGTGVKCYTRQACVRMRGRVYL